MAEPISLRAAKRQARGGGGAAGGMPPANDHEDLPCPVTALGHAEGKFWFMNIVGEKRELSARQLGARADITALFLGDMDWVKSRFKAVDSDGNVKGWSPGRVTEFLMDACRRQGIYGEHVVIRRPGMWRGETGPIAHCGDALFLADGEKIPAGAKRAGQIFAAGAKQPHPALHPAGPDIAQGFAADIRNLWDLEHDGGEIIAIGLVGQSFYAAALDWRANGFLSGGTNSGKSKLLTLLSAMVPMHHFTNDTTKAGVEGAVAGRAMPIFIDETADKGGDAPKLLMDMVLASSSGAGTKGHRGTADGQVRLIEIIGAVIMASINPPDMQAQHRSRFAMIELNRPAGGADNTAAMDAAIARARETAPALFARALAGFPRFKMALAAFRKALAVINCVAREMDQLGAILAGYWMLAEDGVPDEAAAMDVVKIIAEGFVIGAEEMARNAAPFEALAVLLSRIVSLDRSTDQKSIAGLLRDAFGPQTMMNDGYEQARKVLARWGIRPMPNFPVYDRSNRLVPSLSLDGGVWIDERCAPLAGIFTGTPFENGRWKMELGRLPSARKSSGTVRVGDMGPCKARWISAVDIFGIDDTEPIGPPGAPITETF